jgi:hypothetical protein
VLQGSDSVLARDGNEIVDLVRKGQGVLNIIALGPVVEEIDAQIVALAPATQAEHLSRTRTARAAGDGRAAR